jgi:hypothetical protein
MSREMESSREKAATGFSQNSDAVTKNWSANLRQINAAPSGMVYR